MSRPTIVTGIPIRDDLRKSHNFTVGQRVRRKDRHDLCGVVAKLPSGRVVQLGSHTLGNEMGVDLDMGGRAVCNVDQWEAIS